ncbi:MAG TPA: hypothetical protein VGM74_22065 [Burkholderiaceae bacterium]|jgi:hypothetical protein
MKRARLPLAASALALSLGAAAPGFAAEAARKEAAFGRGGAGPVLTRDQLRSCLALKVRAAKQDDELVKEQASITALKDDLVRRGDANKAELEALDRSNEEAVAAYNDKATTRDKQIDDYQARVNAFNARVEAGQADHDSYAKGCNNRRYFEDDEAAINKGK